MSKLNPTQPLNDFDENINTINTIKTIDTIKTNKTNKTKVNFISSMKEANFVTPAGPRGQAAPEVSPEGLGGSSSKEEGLVGQEEGVVEIAEPKLTLAEEKQQLLANNQWITQNQVDYVKVSIFPQLDAQNRYNDFKCQYVIKLKGQDLRKHQYTCKVTHRHNDYLGYARSKWSDADTWRYPEIAEAVKTSWKLKHPAYAGRSAVNSGIRKGRHRMPILAFTSLLLNYENEEDSWYCILWHHEYKQVMSIPNWEWQSALDSWIRDYGIAKEFNKRVPPMIAFEWRNLA